MLHLLLLHLLFHLCVSAKQTRLEDTVKDDLEEEMYKSENNVNEREEELMQRMERMDISWKTEKADLEKKLETMNAEMEKLQKRVKEGEVQIGDINEGSASLKKQVRDVESKLEEISSLKSDMRAEVKKEVDNVLPEAVEQGLRDLPFEMVCALKIVEEDTGVVVGYNRITEEFNNSDRPGGADGTMNIETGVFTTVTSGYYIINYSAFADVHGRGSTSMYLHHNGTIVPESSIATSLIMGDQDNDWIRAQGSRTVVSIAGLELLMSFSNLIILSLRFFICWLVTQWIFGLRAIVMGFMT